MYDLNIEGFMEEYDLKIIEEWAKQVPKNGVVVEVGSFRGRSAVAWAMTCDPSVSIYCIDIFDNDPSRGDDFEVFKKNTNQYKNIIPIRGKSPYEIVFPEIPIDIFFLDAAHENPSDLDNIEYFLPFIKKGGLLCGHDYNMAPGCMAPAIVENIKYLEKKLGKKFTHHKDTLMWSFNI